MRAPVVVGELGWYRGRQARPLGTGLCVLWASIVVWLSDGVDREGKDFWIARSSQAVTIAIGEGHHRWHRVEKRVAYV